MRVEISLYNILLIIATTFVLSWALIFCCKRLAKHLGAIDYPLEARRIHKKPTPRMGGLAIYLSFLIGYMLFGIPSVQMNAVLISGFILVLIGLFDDIKEIPNKIKLIVQIIAALITVFYGDFILSDLTVFGKEIIFGNWGYPITIFFIVGAINCINFIDGMDGLAGGICSIYFLTVGIIATVLKQLGGLDVLLSFVLLGATLGYLKHNFHPAKIFMGDSGSMFLGYMIAVIALIGYKNVTFTSFLIPLALLAIPILDTLLAIIRRSIKHESAMVPDKEHIHFELYRYSKSIKKTVLVIYVIDIILAAASVFFVLGDEMLAMTLYICLILLFIFIIAKTNVLIDWNKKRKARSSK